MELYDTAKAFQRVGKAGRWDTGHMLLDNFKPICWCLAQFQELEPEGQGQVLQRGTTSLPSLPGHSYRQELLGGFPSRCAMGHLPAVAF